MIKQITETLNKHKESLYLLLVVFLTGDAIYEYNNDGKVPIINIAIILLLLPSSLEKYIPKEKFKLISKTTDVLAVIFILIALYFTFMV